jgi:cytochrome P450
VTGPDNLKHVLVTHSHKYIKPKTIKAFVPSVGNGLLTCSHVDHVRQLKMVSPAFSYSSLKGMVAVFQQVSDNLVKVSNIYCTLRLLNNNIPPNANVLNILFIS